MDGHQQRQSLIVRYRRMLAEGADAVMARVSLWEIVRPFAD